MQWLFYTGSFSARGTQGIRSYIFDDEAETLRQCGSCSCVKNPSYIVLSHNGTRLYAVSEQEDRGEIVAFSVGLNGELCELNRVPTPGGKFCHLAVDPVGRYLSAAGYQSGDAVLFALETDGSVARVIFSERYCGSGRHPERQNSPHAHFAAFNPLDPNCFLVVDLGLDRIVQYQITGNRVHLRNIINLPAGDGPRHLVWHPQKPELLYVVCEITYRVHLIRLAGSEAQLLATQPCMPEGFSDFGGSAAIRISPDARRLYVSNRVLEPPSGRDCIACCELDTVTGQPGEFHYSPAGAVPRDINLVGGCLAAACQADNLLQIFRLASDSGLPETVCAKETVPQICCITEARPFIKGVRDIWHG